MALLSVAAAAPLSLLAHAPARPWRSAAAAATLLLLAGAAAHAPRLLDRRAEVVDRDTRRSAARDILAPGLPCLPLVVPNHRLQPVAAGWLDVPLDQVRDGREGIPPGSYLWGTEAAMQNLLVVEGRAGDTASPPPRRRSAHTRAGR